MYFLTFQTFRTVSYVPGFNITYRTRFCYRTSISSFSVLVKCYQTQDAHYRYILYHAKVSHWHCNFKFWMTIPTSNHLRKGSNFNILQTCWSCWHRFSRSRMFLLGSRVPNEMANQYSTGLEWLNTCGFHAPSLTRADPSLYPNSGVSSTRAGATNYCHFSNLYPLQARSMNKSE